MRHRRTGVGAAVIAVLWIWAGGSIAIAGTGDDPLAAAARLAVEGTDAERAEAIGKLRDTGLAGLEAVWALYGDQFWPAAPHESLLSSTPPDHDAERKARVRAALDAVARQRDAHAARLFWHTDFQRASAQAAAEGKPILSLRLLGTLDSDLSCANSRFFRTALYPDPGVNRLLRERFVLHWRSVRPAPRITIDMGDGRVIDRTIVGNSAHYVLDADGRVIDALPGLYGPRTFERLLAELADVHATIAALSAAERAARLRTFHVEREAALGKETTRLLAELGLAEAQVMSIETVDRLMREEDWRLLAPAYLEDARLRASSVALMREKQGAGAREAGRLAVSKARVEDPVLRMVRTLEQSIAEDTARNELRLHRTIHRWLAEADELADVEPLNDRVYRELFLMPPDDPWLGLAPDAYAAIDGGGLSVAKLPAPVVLDSIDGSRP